MQGFDILGFILFAFITSITPGPNNLLLFSHGKHFGFKGAFNLMLGIFLGFSVMLYLTGYGISEIISQNHFLSLTMKIISSLWMFYLAFVLSSIKSTNSQLEYRIIGFKQSFLMQFVNPKAWFMAIASAAAFLPHFQNIHLNVFLFTAIFGLIGSCCMVVWVAFGDLISRFLNSKLANRIISICLFLMMLSSIVLIWV